MSLRFTDDSAPIMELITNDRVQGIVVELVNAETKEVLATVTNMAAAPFNKRRFIHDIICASRIIHRGFLQGADCELRFVGVIPPA